MNSENDESKIQAIIKVGYRYKYLHVQCSMDTQKNVLKRLEKNVTYLPKNNGKRQRNGKHKAVKLMPSFSY